MKPLRRGIVFVFLLAIILSGCASFPGKDLPRYTYQDLKASEGKASVSYDARFIALGNENSKAAETFKNKVERVLKSSNSFEKISTAAASEEYHFSFLLKSEGNYPLAFISGFISGFTFTVLPGFARDEYTLTVDVKKQGQLVKQYQYKQHVDTWIQLFLIALTVKHSPVDVTEQAVDDLLMNFMHDFQQDSLIQT